MRRAAHIDANHAAIVKALRMAGIGVKSLAAVGKGIPDLLCGFRGINVLLEVKNPHAERGAAQGMALTEDEREFHETWPGQVRVVTSADEAVRVVVEAARPQEVQRG